MKIFEFIIAKDTDSPEHGTIQVTLDATTLNLLNLEPHQLQYAVDDFYRRIVRTAGVIRRHHRVFDKPEAA